MFPGLWGVKPQQQQQQQRTNNQQSSQQPQQPGSAAPGSTGLFANANLFGTRSGGGPNGPQTNKINASSAYPAQQWQQQQQQQQQVNQHPQQNQNYDPSSASTAAQWNQQPQQQQQQWQPHSPNANFGAQPHSPHGYPPVASPVDTMIASLRYLDKTRVTRDVASLLSQTNSLQCSLCTLPPSCNNTTISQSIAPHEQLLTLIGTVAITYKSNTYNIPVQILLAYDYPHQPPTCLVTPTPDMVVKPKHPHVDQQGIVYLPFLNQWSANNSSLCELVTMMSSVFSAMPPVFKREVKSNSISKPNAHSSAQSTTVSSKTQPQTASPDSIDSRALQKEKLVALVTDKLKLKMTANNTVIQNELLELCNQKRQLDVQAQALQLSIASLNDEQKRIKQQMTLRSEQQTALQEWLTQHESSDFKLSAEHDVYACDTHSQQLLNCVSIDLALDDALNALDRALSDERIDPAVWIKQVRTIARKQFLERALAQKIIDHQTQQQQAQSAQPQQPQQQQSGLLAPRSGSLNARSPPALSPRPLSVDLRPSLASLNGHSSGQALLEAYKR